MKNKLFFVLILLCLNCTIQYDISTRLIFEGDVYDRYGDPIEINTEVWVNNSSDQDLIAFTTSNSDGNFELVIPNPKNETDFEIKFKGSSIYRQKEYVNIFRSDFQDYLVNLGQITLFEIDDISELIITLNQSNQDNTITNIEIIGLIADETIWVNPSGNQYPEYYYDSYYKSVAKNQNLNLLYEVRNTATGQTNQFNEIITIGSDDTTEYLINY